MAKKVIVCIFGLFMTFVLLSKIGCAQEKEVISFGAEVGNKAEDFTLVDVEGKSAALKDSIGKEAILLVFSTTWCPYCRREIPELKKLHDKYGKKGLKILNVDIQESQEKVASFVEKNSIPYTVLLDLDGTVARQYKVQGVPTLMAIDKKGVIRERGFQIPDESLLEALMGSDPI